MGLHTFIGQYLRKRVQILQKKQMLHSKSLLNIIHIAYHPITTLFLQRYTLILIDTSTSPIKIKHCSKKKKHTRKSPK